MAWVRGHYARGSRTRRRTGRHQSTGVIVLIVLVAILVVYLLAR